MHEIEQARHVVIVVAHPDDEVIGAGALLGHLRGVTILHVTDGSPRDPADALRAGLAKELGTDVTLSRFVRFERGEGIEKPVAPDFASEVAKMAGG